MIETTLFITGLVIVSIVIVGALAEMIKTVFRKRNK